jgi:hypothetical protein
MTKKESVTRRRYLGIGSSNLKFSSFSRPQEIDQTPSLPGCELILECRHAAEAEGDGLEDG